MTTAAILLAAGHSQRFGSDDKLLAAYRGKPLVVHAADALKALAPDHLIAVARSRAVAVHLSGFTVVAPAVENNMQSDSLRAGLAEAMRQGADRILITLGDMPSVTADTMQDVLDRASATEPSAAHDGTTVLPPACFPEPWFAKIMALTGDRGAGSLLQALPSERFVPVEPAILQDIDEPGDLGPG